MIWDLEPGKTKSRKRKEDAQQAQALKFLVWWWESSKEGAMLALNSACTLGHRLKFWSTKIAWINHAKSQENANWNGNISQPCGAVRISPRLPLLTTSRLAKSLRLARPLRTQRCDWCRWLRAQGRQSEGAKSGNCDVSLISEVYEVHRFLVVFRFHMIAVSLAPIWCSCCGNKVSAWHFLESSKGTCKLFQSTVQSSQIASGIIIDLVIDTPSWL